MIMEIPFEPTELKKETTAAPASPTVSAKPINKDSAVSKAIEKFTVEPDTALALRNFFDPLEEQAEQWKEKAFAIVVTDEKDTERMDQARDARLAIRQVRLNVDKVHKKLKEDSLRKGQVLDTIKRVLTGFIEPIEEHLQLQEDFAKVKEKERVDALQLARLEELKPYRVEGDNIDVLDLGNMADIVFQGVLNGVKSAHAQREQDKADQERAKREKEEADQKERDRLKAENEKLKLKNERMMRLQQLGAKVEFDRERKKDSLILWDLKEQESVTWILVDAIADYPADEFEKYYKDFVAVKESNDKFQADQRAASERYTQRVQSLTTIGFVWNADLNTVVNYGIDYALHKRQIEELSDSEFDPMFDEISVRAKKYNDQQDAIRKKNEDAAAELKAKQEKEETERKQRELDQKKAARAPDKVKLLALAEAIENIEQPELKTEDGKAVLLNVQTLLAKVNKYIKEQCGNL